MSREPQAADKYIIRLPDGLRARVKAQAARNRRSMNAEIVLMIERALEIAHPDLPLCSEGLQTEPPCQR
ncbi:Arc family DNA-binding protein [Achromobacter sp.]|uniref:Arc family DNA-binding protein n=1 Tax=Achromobacter sp. TaxID=134375 RepID=UPI000EC18D8A|nr:Arc family DNA-binding protein [Achromobacter sp.]HCW16870.1 hypothetical protein [Achromobacter sp.]